MTEREPILPPLEITNLSEVPEEKQKRITERAGRDAEIFLANFKQENWDRDIPAGYDVPQGAVDAALQEYNTELQHQSQEILSEAEAEAYIFAFRHRCQLGYPGSEH